MNDFPTVAIVVLGCLVVALGAALVLLVVLARRQNAFLRRVQEAQRLVDWNACRRMRARLECERRELRARGRAQRLRM